jgi:hypothetical protein
MIIIASEVFCCRGKNSKESIITLTFAEEGFQDGSHADHRGEVGLMVGLIVGWCRVSI